MQKKSKTGRIFINDGIEGFEDKNVEKIVDDELKEDLNRFHVKINTMRERRGAKNKNGQR